jgi:hypothetical protein
VRTFLPFAATLNFIRFSTQLNTKGGSRIFAALENRIGQLEESERSWPRPVFLMCRRS